MLGASSRSLPQLEIIMFKYSPLTGQSVYLAEFSQFEAFLGFCQNLKPDGRTEPNPWLGQIFEGHLGPDFMKR